MRANRLVVLGSTLALMILLAAHRVTPVRAQRGAPSLPTFRSGVDLVQLDVVVLDTNRHPVSGLTAADFTVLEDGQARPLQAFAPITLPPSPRPETPDAPADVPGAIEFHSDVVTNRRPDDGRLVVIMLDRTIDAGGPTAEARAIGHAIVNALGPNDLAAVVRTSLTASGGGQQGFTDDRRRLHRTLDDRFMGLTNPPEMTSGGLIRPTDAGLASGMGECPGGQCVLETLATVARELGDDPRRQKVIFFIGSQIAFQDSDIKADGQLSVERRRVLDNLSRANVTVHVLDPRGLQTLAKGADAFPGDPSAAQRLQANIARQSGLGVLPAYTGGRAILNTNDPETQVVQLLDEGRIYYLLAFARGAASDDSRLHRVRVVVNRPDVTVRARSGYVATPAALEDRPLDPATQATRGLLPLAGLPLSLVAMPVFDDGFVRAAVGIAVPLEPGPRGDVLRDDHFDAVIQAVDDHARIVSSQGTSFGRDNLQGDTLQQSIRIPVKPGRYEIRVGVTSDAGMTGSVYANVDVPDIAHQDVALSGAVFLPVADDTAMVPLLLVPSVTRTFDRSSPTSAFWQVFRRGGQPIHVSAVLVDDRNQIVVRSEGAVAAGEKGAALITTHRLALPKARMPPGRYELELTVTDGTTSDRRDVVFDVR